MVAPHRLGTGFRWLLASSWLSNLGDGLALAAGPLLVASLTDDARIVALAATLQWLPPLLFGLGAGVASDRLDRRLLVVVVNGLRAGVLMVLATAVLTDHVGVRGVLLALFLGSIAEVFADNTTGTLLPMLVSRSDLAVGNARLQAGFITMNQLAGPSLGAGLFAVGSFWPFLTQAALVALGATTATRIVLPSASAVPGRRRSVRRDLAEGFGWVRHHRAVRTLMVTIFVFNITFGAAWGVLVLYATQRLDMGAVGFGALTTVSALGGLVGTLGYGALTRRVSLTNLMRVGLVVETLTHLALALTTDPAVALAVFFVFGAHAFVWGTTAVTVRQRAVPTALQGRVGAVYGLGVYGGLVLGSAVGGMLARHLGVVAPFWFGFVGSAAFVVLVWHDLRHVAHDDESATAASA